MCFYVGSFHPWSETMFFSWVPFARELKPCVFYIVFLPVR